MPDYPPFSLSDLLNQPQTQPAQPNGLLGALQRNPQMGNGLLGSPTGALSPATANPNMMAQGMTARGMTPNNDPSWYREDGSKKGRGFFGLLPFKDGRTSSELSIGVNMDGKEIQIPSLVPTLAPEEIQHLLQGGQMTPQIVQKAVDHARQRMLQGLSPFAD